jgi:hypothetical protein
MCDLCVIQGGALATPIVGEVLDTDNVGWDALVLLSLLCPGDVWLSRYSESALSELAGEIRTVVIEGTAGRVISAAQLRRR